MDEAHISSLIHLPVILEVNNVTEFLPHINYIAFLSRRPLTDIALDQE